MFLNIIILGTAGNEERIFDFGNGAQMNNLILTRSGTSAYLRFDVIPYNSGFGDIYIFFDVLVLIPIGL